MEIIADLRNYTSVVLGTHSNDNMLQQVNIIPLDNNQVIALVCTNKGIVENKKFKVPENIFMGELVKTCEIINKMLVGTPIDEVSQRLEFDIKPIISKTIKQYETVYEIFYDAFNDFVKHNTNIHVSGRVNLLKEPEYDNTDDIKRIASKLEDESFMEMVNSIDGNEELQVYIGADSNFDDNVTVIKRKYKTGGEEGTIAIIGPKRMEYERVVSLLNYMVDKIEGK